MRGEYLLCTAVVLLAGTAFGVAAGALVLHLLRAVV